MARGGREGGTASSIRLPGLTAQVRSAAATHCAGARRRLGVRLSGLQVYFREPFAVWVAVAVGGRGADVIVVRCHVFSTLW